MLSVGSLHGILVFLTLLFLWIPGLPPRSALLRYPSFDAPEKEEEDWTIYYERAQAAIPIPLGTSNEVLRLLGVSTNELTSLISSILPSSPDCQILDAKWCECPVSSLEGYRCPSLSRSTLGISR